MKEDYKYQDIKELADNFNSIQMELRNKIEDYLIEILCKFTDDFIEFDEKQQEETKYLLNGNKVTLTTLLVDYYNHSYVELVCTDNNGNVVTALLSEMTIEQQMRIIENVRKYIDKYGWKNRNNL